MIYNPGVHMFVTFKQPSNDDAVYRILHHTIQQGVCRIWIHLHATQPRASDTIQVGDGLHGGYDEQGYGVFTVPHTCLDFLTQEEADDVMKTMALDEKLLGYAG